MKTLQFCLLTLLTFCQTTIGQNNEAFTEAKPTILGINTDYGYILKHAPSLRQIDDAFPLSIGVDWSKHLITKKSWDFCNCFPRVGVSLEYWNWDNPEVLGFGVLPVGYVEPYFRTQNRTNIFVRLGLGGAFLSTPFDEVFNPLNESYSTLFSFAIVVGAGINYRINDQLNLRAAVKYNHISNGGVSTPNKGLNFPSLSLGVNKSLEPIIFPVAEKTGKREPPEEKTRVSLIHFSGWSNANIGDKDKFYVFGFLGQYARWIGGRSAITTGTEWIFDYSRKERFKLEGNDSGFAQGALMAGHEFWLGNVTFSQQLGIYYFIQNRNTDLLYQRYGLTYSFTKHLFAGVNLKVHRHVADFFDFRVGYTF